MYEALVIQKINKWEDFHLRVIAHAATGMGVVSKVEAPNKYVKWNRKGNDISGKAERKW
ncbi:hypothetical protein HM1_2475 [Heliomicrobium modesticaldum Ice1]|uniref:Uncharacterized protein n=1 Tax=Heliobacterium modesticaldum (strain ATCC 51547 / Ice1) TaxID=498761 RepID=B0TAH5_HELMI|nr:hypothetical protein HM1_2475 [Heliomicrobium modesticaldum Ice1]